MTKQEFLTDCESICFDCAGKPFKVIAPGVSLCFKCYVKELYDRFIRRLTR